MSAVPPILLATDLDNISFTSSVGDNSVYPASNLNNYLLASIWKSATSGASQYLWWDYGSSDIRQRTTLAITRHNFAGIMSSGNIKLQYDDNSGFSSPGTAVNGVGTSSDIVLSVFGGSLSYRYWRLLFDGSLTTAPQLGNVFVDVPWYMPYPSDLPIIQGNRGFTTVERVTLSGILRRSQTYAGRKRWRFSWRGEQGGLDDTTRAEFQIFFNFVRGKLKPFYFVDMDGTSVYYVYFDFDVDPNELFRYNINNFPEVTLIAQEVG